MLAAFAFVGLVVAFAQQNAQRPNGIDRVPGAHVEARMPAAPAASAKAPRQPPQVMAAKF
jgi:hypothetical protein